MRYVDKNKENRPPNSLSRHRLFQPPAIAKSSINGGMPQKHIVALLSAANELNTAIIVRPTNQFAKSLIDAGLPGKTFAIKAKSADWGPMAGFIPTNPIWSKLGLKAAASKLNKAKHNVTAALTNNDAKAIPLILSTNRLNELSKMGTIKMVHLANNMLQINAFKHASNFTFFAHRSSNQQWEITDHNHESIFILAHPVTRQPFTADYDLLTVAPKIDCYGNKDKVPVPDVCYQTFQTRLAHYQLSPHSESYKKLHTSEQAFYEKEDPKMGNVSPRICQLIDYLNKKLGCHEHNRLVLHNADETNPASNMQDNIGAIAFIPGQRQAGGTVRVITSIQALQDLYKELKNNGFHCKINPRWGETFKHIRRQSFDEARDALDNRMKNSQTP